MSKSADLSLRLLGTGLLIFFASAILEIRAQSERVDYLNFAEGALVLTVGGDDPDLRVGLERALRVIDGDRAPFVLGQRPAGGGQPIELLIQLPARTAFDRFAVPGVAETPSPSQTFIRDVEIWGSAESAERGFVKLAQARLSTHESPDEISELEVIAETPVLWVKIVLSGSIEVQSEKFFQDFTEVIGNGKQESVPLEEEFTGIWKYRANVLELKQEGVLVSGCYDDSGRLEGTVSGALLRATGISEDDSVPSVFLMRLDPDGEIRGVRSTNGAPFASYDLPAAAAGTTTPCTAVKTPSLGCGSIIHGIQFDFDSAVIRAESAPILDELFRGLESNPEAAIVIEGHTSAEGSEDYNHSLSERRAAAVVQELLRRGISANRLAAVGEGEAEPIAGNDDESGRSLNRRVEIVCSSLAG